MYICVGLVLVFRHIFKPQNVKCNIFSELTLKASLLLFRLIISKNSAEKFCVISEIWTEPCRKTLCWKYVVETNLCAKNQVCVKMESWKRTLRLNVVLFIKFRKYKTAFNSGLKIWLVSGKPEIAQLFNLKFFLYLCWFGFGSSPHFQASERCRQHIFWTYAEGFSPTFSE